MIAYNPDWLKNLWAIESATKAFRQRLISKNEMDAIRQKFDAGFYTPNTFIRIGLFLLTLVICLFSFGLICLLFVDSGDTGFAVMGLFFGFVTYGCLEYLVHTRHHYKSGGDDALLWIAAGFLFGGVSVLTGANDLQNCMLVFVIATTATLRFADRVMTAVAVLSFYGIIFYLLTENGQLFRTGLPFVFMALATAQYFSARAILPRREMVPYKSNLWVVQALSLVTCYVAGNYLVVRELSNELFQLNLPPGASLPFGWVFWTVTCLLPVVYLYFGIARKDRLLLWVGLLVLSCTILTLKFYYYIAPAEVLMAFFRSVLLIVTYGLIKYLRKPRRGFVYATQEDEGDEQVESLVIAETVSPIPAQPEPSRFGGGGFGGAGSSAGF